MSRALATSIFHDGPLQPPGEIVVENGGRDRDEQAGRRRDQRLGDARRDDRRPAGVPDARQVR